MTELNLTVSQLAERLGGEVVGNDDVAITGIATLGRAGAGDVTFLTDARRASALAETKAGAAIVGRDHPPAETTLICVDNVPAAVAAVLEMFSQPQSLPAPGVHPTATVAEDAEVDATAAIGPGAVVGSRAKVAAGAVLCANVAVGADAAVGEKTILHAGTVVLDRCRIGRRCRIGPNAVIGSSGFGYYFAEGRHNRITHIGAVEIGDEVDIGACSCVDRGKFDDTRVGDGTKIDNLVQVAHSVQIGRGCALAAMVGIAGSAVLKDYVILGGHVGVRDNIVVGAGAKAAACSCIAQNVPDGATVAGIPAYDARKWLRTSKILPDLSELKTKIRQLEKRLAELESADH